ncbi:cache domain-containing protein [Desulfatibacillum aliphaticivorans]|uniref:cache domain-containing protein n=1 Tax=Desulfatibacillum aliphaticivorans TaxID=218208 RepID=UPI001B7F8A82|nr:cache domain-containing protein [Desulfatibacillum aliphaticivorans]
MSGKTILGPYWPTQNPCTPFWFGWLKGGEKRNMGECYSESQTLSQKLFPPAILSCFLLFFKCDKQNHAFKRGGLLLLNNRIKNNLQIKVIALFLPLSLIPMVAVGVFSLKTAEEIVVSMVNIQMNNVADDKVNLLERWLTERRADLLVIADSSFLGSMDPDIIGPYLNSVCSNYKVYREVFVISSEGEIVFRNTGVQSGEEWRDGLEYPIDSYFMSEITFRPGDKESAFRIAAPILDEKGHARGTVFATVGTSSILNIILKVSLGETGECYLVDKNGAFLAHNDPRRILTENISHSGSFTNIFVSQDRETAYLDYRGIEVLGTSRKVPGTDWYLVVEQDRDEAFQSAQILKRHFFLIAAFSLCYAVVLAWAISRYLISPIKDLSRSANILADGEFDKAAVRTDRKDEIGLLYQAFNHMALQLKERQDSLAKEVDLKESELHETDIMLQQSRLAAARSEKFAALGRLGAGVTHEIRTPLTSIKLFLESVQSEIEISPDYKEDFMIAMMQVTRIENTINRFLDFAKPQKLVFSSMDIQQVVEDVLSVVRPMANKQECIVYKKIGANLPKIQGDKKILEEALINLLINSLEAMELQGRIDVSAKMGSFQIDGKDVSCVRVDISDTGSGISEENIPNVFDPFFTTKASGSGLGLSMAHSAIQRHGGGLRVESTVGKGTIFSIFLPTEQH